MDKHGLGLLLARRKIIFEVESRWDPEKKQYRRSRFYLGKLDPETGGISRVRSGKGVQACQQCLIIKTSPRYISPESPWCLFCRK